MRVFLQYIFYLYLIVGLNNKISAQKSVLDDYSTLKKYSGMTLEVRYAECGEWGGHKEKIQIIDSAKKLFLAYKTYQFNCDSLDYYYYNDNPPLLLSKSKFLEGQDLAEISGYIQKLNQAKLEETCCFHAGEVYSVCNGNSTLVIRYTGFDSVINMSYKKLITLLFP